MNNYFWLLLALFVGFGGAGCEASESSAENAQSGSFDGVSGVVEDIHCADYAGTTVESACGSFAEASCATDSRYDWSSEESCRSNLTNACAALFGLAGVRASPNVYAAYADLYSWLGDAPSMTDSVRVMQYATVSLSKEASCGYWFGTRAVGESCVSPLQCASASCAGAALGSCGTCVACTPEDCNCDTATGTCLETLVSAGGSCETDDACGAGLFCNNSRCVAIGEEGDACSGDNDDLDCAADFVCSDDLICVKRSASGTACSSDSSRDVCVGFCVDGICVDEAQEGDSCVRSADGETSNCSWTIDLDCDASTQICIGAPSSGEACQGEGSTCRYAAECDGSICQPLPEHGESCSGNCEGSLPCYEGVCVAYYETVSCN